MSKLTREDILRLAKLARLRLSENEVEAYQKELSSILEYVRVLDSVDVSGLEPTYQVTGLTNRTRKDKITGKLATIEELLSNVPQLQDSLIKVKRMIG